jgi:hypothetical protein
MPTRPMFPRPIQATRESDMVCGELLCCRIEWLNHAWAITTGGGDVWCAGRRAGRNQAPCGRRSGGFQRRSLGMQSAKHARQSGGTLRLQLRLTL